MTQSIARRGFVPLAAILWLGLAIAAAGSGWLAAFPSPGPQLLILVLTGLTVLVGLRAPALRSWIDTVDLRVLVGMHLIRFIGAYFLYLAGRGQLSPVFAARAGWGDILAASLAGVLVLTGPPRSVTHRRAYLAWNVIGLLDFVVVLVTAAAVARQDPAGVAALLRLPLSLVPTFFVPLLIASHLFIFRRLRSGAAGARA